MLCYLPVAIAVKPVMTYFVEKTQAEQGSPVIHEY